jgi:hypothetical protein
MLPTSRLESYLEHTPAELRDIVLELRNLIASVAPDAAEVRHSRGFTYYDDKRGGPVSAGICQISIYKDHVRLAFIHGAFLPDPQRLLEGERLYKKYVRLTSFDDVPWEYLQRLMLASASLDPHTLDVNKP